MNTYFYALFATPYQNWLGRILYQVNNILVFLFFILTFLVWGGTGYSAGIMLLLSPLALFIKNKPLRLTKPHYLIISALLLMFISHTFAIYRGNSTLDLSDLDHPLRFLFIIPILLYLKKVGFNQVWFWLGVYLAGLICGWQSLTFPGASDGARVLGPFNPIIWGDIALVFCITIGVKAHQILKNKQFISNSLKYAELSIAAVSFLGAFSGVMLSGSRGAWLTAILLVLLFVAYAALKLPMKLSIAAMSATIIISILAYSFVPTIHIRTDRVVSELKTFELNSNNRTSTGLRLQMWYTSLKAFEKKPLFGLGQQGLTEFEQLLVEEGTVNEWVVTQSSQQHSDLFDTMAKNGLFGILVLLYFYYAHLKVGRVLKPPYANILILTTLAYIGFGLTNTIFVGMNGTMFYLVFILFVFILGKPQNDGTRL